MSGWKKLAAASAGGGAGLDVDEVFSTYLYKGDYNAGELNQHIKNNISLGSLGSGGSSVNFSGNQYLTRSDFSGNSDGKELTFSAWILFNDFENNFVFSSDPNGGGTGINVGYFSGKLRFYAYNTGGSVVSEWHVDDSNTPFHQWFHLCFSVNTASGVAATKVYINDVAATKESVSSSNQNIDRTRTAQRLAVRGTDYKLTGNLAHVYMDYTYRNLDTESNRRLFIDANGGSTDPSTLSALNPIMYCPLTDDYTMGKNLGTGGDFTSSGGPTFSSLGTEATADASGGLVWIKNRDQTDSHMLFDTERGASKSISSNDSSAEVTTNPDTLTQFLADGFFLGDDVAVNTNNEDYASWTFRKAPKFFDVVTYTGNGIAGRTVAHNLGSAPGCIILKCTSAAENWHVYHRGNNNGTNPEDYYFRLNGQNAKLSGIPAWNDTAPTDSVFSLGDDSGVNGNGATFVAYLFAHNDGDGEFGPDGDQDIIKCDKYLGGAATKVDIDCGFEPSWVMIKSSNEASDWVILDNMRGVASVSSGSQYLEANTSNAEAVNDYIHFTPTGFQTQANNQVNAYGGQYTYIAIRRGSLAVPEDATKVFDIGYYGQASTSAPAWHSEFPLDFAFYRNKDTDQDFFVYNRLTQGKGMYFRNPQEFTDPSATFDFMDGYYNGGGSNSSIYSWMWKRAPSFFDVVPYTGNGVQGLTLSHNLGVAPEMMWVKKRRPSGGNWIVYHSDLNVNNDNAPETDFIVLNTASAASDYDLMWADTAPTATEFTIGRYQEVNNSNETFIAYLFASAPSVSKVGSYTGNGSSQTIDCGFTAGARFILIKRADSSGDWYIWDTARGIVAGNDPHLALNRSDQAEVTSDDSVDPANSGFIVNQVSATNINVSSASYIFYAIA